MKKPGGTLVEKWFCLWSAVENRGRNVSVMSEGSVEGKFCIGGNLQFLIKFQGSNRIEGKEMAKSGNWPAFAAGAAFGALAMAGALAYKREDEFNDSRVVHIERSVNIGRSVEKLFSTWMDLERIPQLISLVKKAERVGSGSHWTVNVDGRQLEWDAQTTQVIFNESIGWKSVNGPRHSGRISFSPLGDQTVVHVMMSYAPRAATESSLAGIETNLEQWIERGLREFKASMEDDSLRRESLTRESLKREPMARTGTTGAEVESYWNTGSGPAESPGKPAVPGSVSYTRPPKERR
jgi:uncharacterized membrane protein